MIRSIHWGGCIVITADKRSMICNIEAGTLGLHTDQEQTKIPHVQTQRDFLFRRFEPI